MKKRGQVTIFIIIAIVIVAAIILFVYIRSKNSSIDKIPSDIKPIYNYVQSCIIQTAYFGVYEIGTKGGYYFPAKESVVTGEAYYALSKISLIPSNNTIESQLTAYIEANLGGCLNNFTNFPGFDIFPGHISAETTLGTDKFIININYPIKITKGQSSYLFSDFKDIEVITSADLLHKIASNYSDLFLKSGGVSLTYASNIKDSYNIITTFQHFPDYTLVTLTDSKGINNNLTYQWGFALA